MLDICVILDRSGSMQTGRDDHEGGLRSFVRDQQDAGDDAYFTLVQFDDTNPCEVVIDRVPIRDVREDDIRLVPRGSTPLHDAVGKAVAHLRTRQGQEQADTMVMVITDGYENASIEWTKAKVKALVEERERAGWKFLYLGANVDAFHEGGAIGVTLATTANYSPTSAGIHAVYGATTSNLRSARATMGARGSSLASVSDTLNFTEQQREEMSGLEDPQWPTGSFVNVPPTHTGAPNGTVPGRRDSESDKESA